MFGERRGQYLGKRGSVDVALAVVGEPRIVGEFRLAEELRHLAELTVVA